jgi:RNA polymerase sigma-70 factor (ECF subfamily)
MLMSGLPEPTAQKLSQARDGSRQALGELLEGYRGYLLMIAREEIGGDLQAKASASDLVQQTFLEAQQDFARFQGNSEAELRAWLRRLLVNNVANFTRRYRDTDKRAVGREVSLEEGDSVAKLAGELAADTPPPSGVLVQEERARAVRLALDRLPEDYRQVLLLRHQEELPFEEIARLMGRSANAVQKLWARAVQRMEEELDITL